MAGALTVGLTWLPDNTPPWPLVVFFPGAAPEPPGMHRADARPITATAFPHTVTGALTVGLTWFPDSTPFRPLVMLWLDGATELPGLHCADARPITATALPHTVTGALIVGLIWLPDKAPPRPLVVLWLGAEEELAGAHPADALPALPHTITGALRVGLTWFPEPTPPLPLVALWLGGAPEPPGLHCADARPITATAFPHTVIGALTAGLIWLPDRTPPRPLVWLLLAGGEVLGFAVRQLAALLPITLMSLPHTVIGALIVGLTWLPEPAPFLPSVVSACAMPTPISHRPMPMRATWNARNKNRRMVCSLS
jgi:hypothetical protein